MSIAVLGLTPHLEDTLLQESHTWNRNRLKRKSIGMFKEQGGSGGFPSNMKKLCSGNLARGTGIDLSGSLYGCLICMGIWGLHSYSEVRKQLVRNCTVIETLTLISIYQVNIIYKLQ